MAFHNNSHNLVVQPQKFVDLVDEISAPVFGGLRWNRGVKLVFISSYFFFIFHGRLF